MFAKLLFRSLALGCCVLLCAGVATRSSVAIAQTTNPLPRVEPQSPTEALQTFRTEDGFRMELLAAEPLVTDPVAIAYDENGLAYVAEMGDYPFTDRSKDAPFEDQTSPPSGRVRLLEDLDGDGRLDKSTVFAERISWPTGVACWKGGVFVTATPDVLYLKDTDGDHVADVRRRVWTGFRKYNVQAVINNLKWGLDHRIYGAGSSNGGEIRHASRTEEAAMRMGRNDFRFDPRDESFELLSGGARFGNTFDDWGNRFICNIRNPVQHVVLANRYLARNPYLPVRAGVHDASASGEVPVYRVSPAEPWRVINAGRLVADPLSTAPTSEKAAVGFVTSSSGITIYRGAAYPEAYYGNAFIGEVAGNLVMRYVLSADGATFRAERAREKKEFLASTDNWFRPVNFINAPDGTLHVLDMYRETIEHPWSIPDDIKRGLDLTSGRDRGRIYRLVPAHYREGFEPPGPPRLGEASIARLVAELANPNAWWRETAHRLIFERQDPAAIPLLRTLFRESPSPVARLHALWLLQGLGALEESDVAAALDDESPRLRETAVLLAEPLLDRSPELLQQVIEAAEDDDPRVRFQVALALGDVDDPRAADTLSKIVRRDAADPWTRTAVLSARSDSATALLAGMLQDTRIRSETVSTPMVSELAHVVGARHRDDEVKRVLSAAAELPPEAFTLNNLRALRLTLVASLGAGLQRAGKSLDAFAADKDEPWTPMLIQMFDETERTAHDSSADVAERLQAIQFVAYRGFNRASAVLVPLLKPQEPQAIQRQVVTALASFADPAVTNLLLEEFQGLSPQVRSDVVLAMLARSDRVVPLLDAIAAGRVSASLVPPVRRLLLLKSGDDQVKERAMKLFAADSPGARDEVVARYQSALSLGADAARGEVVFKRECLNCHRHGQQGHDVGPNLATVAHRTPAELMTNILDPNREVSPNYLEYIIATTGGRIVTGIIAAETATSITLSRTEGQQETVLRRDIDSMASSGMSLMPEGLEQKITPQEMADLLAFLLGPTREER